MNNLCVELCKLPPHYIVIVFVLTSAIEAWLGSTTKTKSGSILALIVNLVLALPRWYINRRIASGKTL